ncbi:MAG: DEAD/DEAH box helicase [Armatimonadota bacterium]
MRFEDLRAGGLPEAVIEIWREEYGEELLPVQRLAVEQGRLVQGQNLVVTTPTSSGKTLVAEMSMVPRAMSGIAGLYLVPTRALAEAKYVMMRRLYEPLGLRVAVCTRDHTNHSRAVRAGKCDIVVAVPEKIQALIGGDGRRLNGLFGTVAADELQLLYDPQRGECLEMLLAPLIQDSVQIIGLSASLPGAAEIARWLQARHLSSRRRPVKLRVGVLSGTQFRYLQRPGGATGTEKLDIRPVSGDLEQDIRDIVAPASGSLADESVLVFVRDRKTAIRVAREIADHRPSTTPSPAVQEINRLSPTAVRIRLATLLKNRVAFHTTDLQFSERRIVERAFAEGAVDVLVSTSTLAQGLNLPARNVIIDPYVWRTRPSESISNLCRLCVMDPGEFDARAGRAGRLRSGDDFGRAIITAHSPVRARALWDRYIQRTGRCATAALETGSPSERRLIRICAAFDVGGCDDVTGALQKTLRGAGHQEAAPADIRAVAERCRKMGLLGTTPPGHFTPTDLGRLFATTGLSIDSFRRLLHFASQNTLPDPWDALLVSATLPEARAANPFGPGTAGEPDSRNELLQRASERETDAWWTLGTMTQILSDRDIPLRHRRTAARLTVAMLDWTGCSRTRALERRTGQPAARIERAGRCVAWLMRLLCRIYQALDDDSRDHPKGGHRMSNAPDVVEVMKFADRCAAGVTEPGRALQAVRVPGVDRDHVHALVAAGYAGIHDIMQADVEALAEVVPGPIARVIYRAAADSIFRDVLPSLQTGDDPFAEAAPTDPLLQMDPERPFEAVIYGTRVDLSRSQFRMLEALAQKPGKCVEYEDIYANMWEDEQFVHSSQLYSHRCRLAKKLRQAAGDKIQELDDGLMVTVRDTGIILNLPPEKVKLSREG